MSDYGPPVFDESEVEVGGKSRPWPEWPEGGISAVEVTVTDDPSSEDKNGGRADPNEVEP